MMYMTKNHWGGGYKQNLYRYIISTVIQTYLNKLIIKRQ